MFPLRRHLSIRSVCSSDCELCLAIGCLHPHRRSLEDIRAELDIAKLTLCDEVVLPPNSIEHEDVHEVVELCSARGLTPVLRLHPRQFDGPEFLKFKKLIRSLAKPGTRFELLLDGPVPGEVFDRICQLKPDLPELVTVFIPTRGHNLSMLLDAIPFELRPGLRVLALLNRHENDRYLNADETSQWLDQMRLRQPEWSLTPYAEFDRNHPLSPAGFNQVPNLKPVFERRLSIERVQFSVVIAFHHQADHLHETLESIAKQGGSTNRVEVIVVSDKSSKNELQKVRASLEATELPNVALYSLPDDGFGTRKTAQTPRTGLMRNVGAWAAHGDRLVFLDSEVVLPSGWLDDLESACRDSEVVLYGREDLPASWVDFDRRWLNVPNTCISVRVRDFVRVGGFARVLLHSGCEMQMFAWKLSRLELRWSSRSLALHSRKDAPLAVPGFQGKWNAFRAKLAELRALSPYTQAFYLSTLDPEVYRTYFTSMGAAPALRLFLVAAIEKNGSRGCVRLLHWARYFPALQTKRALHLEQGAQYGK